MGDQAEQDEEAYGDLRNVDFTRLQTRASQQWRIARQLMDVFSQPDMEPTRFPMEPPDGTVLRWYKTFPNSPKEYSYVATRAGDKWYHTASARSLPPNPVGWEAIRDDIGNWPCELARTWGQIPQAPAGAFDGADPDDWFREMYENTVTVDETPKGD
ncbi:MAG: hypothetical protein LC749_01595 [Actinobacteria bacterium]|nr:hypothetical protein [Actinomycetota bacterium]